MIEGVKPVICLFGDDREDKDNLTGNKPQSESLLFHELTKNTPSKLILTGTYLF